MAELLNYAEEYSRALANAYPNQLHFAALRSAENNNKYRWVNAKTIEIPRLKVGGRTDGDRNTIGSFTRNFDNDWEPKELKFYRTWQTLVDPKDIDETNQIVTIANITKTMNEEEKFPEMDAYLSSKLYADWTDAGGKEVSTKPTADNILEIFDDAITRHEAGCPEGHTPLRTYVLSWARFSISYLDAEKVSMSIARGRSRYLSSAAATFLGGMVRDKIGKSGS